MKFQDSPKSNSVPLINDRAVAYVRMSTERQEYSTRNQLDAIEEYASERDLKIVVTYEDAGKSGLTKKSRPALCRLIDDVQKPHDFAFILVYDITRWGRFQDVDESAYYEYLCRLNGVNIVYCAEAFDNDGSAYASIIKAVKRIAAADYSRELSIKVFKGQCRIISMGYKVGGPAGYGLRRILLNEFGDVLQVLRHGERKALQNYRVVLAPGPEFEIAVVNQIFQWYVDGVGDIAISDVLNEQKITAENGGLWTRDIIRLMLKNEKYIGNLVYNKSSFKLHRKYVRNPPAEWIRCNNAFQAIVPKELFLAAEEERARRHPRYTYNQLIDCLLRVYNKHGRVSCRLIDAEAEAPNARLIAYRFGSMRDALTASGISQTIDDSFLETRSHLYSLRRKMISEIQELIANAGGHSVAGTAPFTLLINEKILISIRAIRCDHDLKYDYYRWRIPKIMSLNTDFVLFAQMDHKNDSVLRYFLFHSELFVKDIAFTKRSICRYEKYGREKLADFFLITKFLLNENIDSF